jgi:hypothetical protein
MPGQKTKRAIKNLAHKAKYKTIEWVTHFLEFLMVIASLLWAAEAHAERSVPLKNLRVESNLSQVNPALTAKEGKRGLASTKTTPPKANGTTQSSLDLDSVLRDKGTFRAPESIASGRYLPESFRSNPFFVLPSFELFRFPSGKGR